MGACVKRAFALPKNHSRCNTVPSLISLNSHSKCNTPYGHLYIASGVWKS